MPVEHSKELSGPNGESNNQAEEFNGRFDRMERGTHLHIGEKYALDYAAENAFRSDTRRLPNGRQLEVALNIAMSVGRSKFWTGFTHGNHGGTELTLPLPRLARASGPAKGQHPISSANGRPPR
ncbi:transposase [Massilia sp. TWR1-2-2]|uniref:transposase n=1 Tax=Massilia sp. TWR1-2-2 TaxID=2804584 RepID=UPI003CF469BA